MASGKSEIGKKLAETVSLPYTDLDAVIETQEGMSIAEIFKSKGEIYFRKIETKYLKQQLIKEDKQVLALGGGTPCYGTNMDLIKNDEQVKSIYLKVSVQTLTDRLFQERQHRPLVSHISNKDEMLEFVGKHLFERNPFYSQATYTVDAEKNTEDLIEAILLKLF